MENRMKREDIEGLFTTDSQDELKNVLDDFEGKFNQIRDLLAEITINNLDDIPAAHDIARDVSNDLY
jgi:hypothetical protein